MPPLDLEEVVMDVNNFDILLEQYFLVQRLARVVIVY
jgi:hypothetical protein